ncbi:MAG: methylmalonyl-CoA mutase family protein [Bacteroidales bacterium]
MKEQSSGQLFTGFPEISTEQWEEKIRSDLKGADYRKKLIWKTEEGIELKPYYREEDLESLSYLRHAGSLRKKGEAPHSWMVCQDIELKDRPEEANRKLKMALKGGAQSVRILLEDSLQADSEWLDRLLEGISVGETGISFRGSVQADRLYEELLKLAGKKGVPPSYLNGGLGADPLGKMAETGIPVASMENLGSLVKKVMKQSPSLRVISVNGALFQNAGSTLTEELGFALAMANDYMALLTDNGIDPSEAVLRMQLDLTTGTNYFMEIAKLRAARILWARICQGYGIKPNDGKIHIHSTSSLWNMTLYDPHVNILRGTTEAMAAIIGGADKVSVLPFELPAEKSSLFSDRIARNIQIILREEAYFDRVADPASGSYYLENLTHAVADQAWRLFLSVESKGGFPKAFESGMVQETVYSSLQRKKEKAATGRLKLVGTNVYPNFNELVLAGQTSQESRNAGTEQEGREQKLNQAEELGRRRQGSGTEQTGQVKSNNNRPPLEPVRPFRLASIFEEVRLQTERSGKRPKVFLFKYGDPRWMTARANFSGNFFACAGYEILDQPGFKNLQKGIRAARASGADVIVLCSSDDSYAEMAPAVKKALRDKALVVIAGYPENAVEDLREAGIRHFIHVRTNLLESLKEFNKILLGS